jgi:hypothetical protein
MTVNTLKMTQAYSNSQMQLRLNSNKPKVTNQNTEAQELLTQVQQSTRQCKNPSHLGNYVDLQA